MVSSNVDMLKTGLTAGFTIRSSFEGSESCFQPVFRRQCVTTYSLFPDDILASLLCHLEPYLV